MFLIAAEGLSLLTKRAILEGLLQVSFVGSQGLQVSHIQYADDTLFVVDGSRGNAEAIKWLLKNFELVSSLEVNFDKSSAYGVNLESEKLEELAGLIECLTVSMLIRYLGLKVGGRVNGAEGWTDVVEKVKGCLRRWGAKTISMGGRVIVVNSILTATPIYCMCHFYNCQRR